MICESFNCTPGEAMDQDWALINQILDYRLARTAMDTAEMKDQKQAVAILTAHPEMIRMMGMMRRAQTGRPLHGETLVEEGRAVVAEYAPAEKDGEE